MLLVFTDVQVCVVGDDIRVCERPSLPDLPPGLTGSFAFDSQKPYPTLAEVSPCCGGIFKFVYTMRWPALLCLTAIVSLRAPFLLTASFSFPFSL